VNEREEGKILRPYRIGKHCAEALEAVCKSTRILPVLSTNISSRVVRDAASIYDDSQNDQSDTCNDFDDGKHEFNYSRDSFSPDIDGSRRLKNDLPSP
jgi:hypothetical protein